MGPELGVAETAALLDGVRAGWAGDLVGWPLGTALLVVNADEPHAGVDLRPPPGLAAAVVAVSESPDLPPVPLGVDVAICRRGSPPAPWVGAPTGIDGAVGRLADVLEAQPTAAATLLQVLRVTESLPVPDALVVESLAYSALQSGPEHLAWRAAEPARSVDDLPTPAVLVGREGSRLFVELARPERRNAYSARMRDELVAALQLAAADDSIREIYLSGQGANLSSGGDLAEFGSLADPASAHLVRTARSAAYWLYRLVAAGREVVVHAHGACVGAGTELTGYASTVIAAADTTFRLPEVAMGLIPGAGGTVSLPRRIGRERATWLALTGLPIDAFTAGEWGLADQVTAAVEPG